MLAGCHLGGAALAPSGRAAPPLPLPTGARLDPAAPSFAAGNMPHAIVPAPGHPRRFVVLLSGWREQGVQIVDPTARRADAEQALDCPIDAGAGID